MSRPATLGGRLARVLIPTRVDLLACLLVAIIVLAISCTGTVLERLGVVRPALNASQSELSARFSAITHSYFASSIALVAFWSVVGLLAYIVCWAAYNLVVEARNQVTIETHYANRGSSTGPWVTIAIKALSAAGLVLAIWSVKYGYASALALVTSSVSHLSATSAVWAAAGVALFSLNLYAVLACAELTLTPWYRSDTFTDS